MRQDLVLLEKVIYLAYKLDNDDDLRKFLQILNSALQLDTDEKKSTFLRMLKMKVDSKKIGDTYQGEIESILTFNFHTKNGVKFTKQILDLVLAP